MKIEDERLCRRRSINATLDYVLNLINTIDTEGKSPIEVRSIIYKSISNIEAYEVMKYLVNRN